MDDKLKPCPFCGGENFSEWARGLDEEDGYIVHCKKCYADRHGIGRKGAYKNWNTRVQPEVNVPEIEWVYNWERGYYNYNHTDIIKLTISDTNLDRSDGYTVYYYEFGTLKATKKFAAIEEAKAKAYDILKERVQQIVNTYTK